MSRKEGAGPNRRFGDSETQGIADRERDPSSPRKHCKRAHSRHRRQPFSLVRQRMREIERIMKLRFPIPPADLKRYLVPYAQHIGQHLRECGKPATHSEIAERIEIKSKSLGIAAEVAQLRNRALTSP